MLLTLTLILFLFCPSKQDIYLHNPRGSNNRLNEQSATRKNNNRAFDSQNNARGGYNIGESTNTPFTNESQQYQMKYFQSGKNGGSFLNIEWTEQHGCGGNLLNNPNKVNCLIIIQYMCQTATDFDIVNLDRFRDGLNTNNQDYTKMSIDTLESHVNRKQNDLKLDRVLQESWEYYDNCYYRNRNAGLFTADQNLKNNEKGYSSAIFTRQNPNGQRSGYECPEERDYYPYWHPNGGWKDIAILTSDTSHCDYYKKESFNTKPKHSCVEFYENNSTIQKHWSQWNTEEDCLKYGGKWIELHNYLEKALSFKNQAVCESDPTRKWAVPFDSKNVNIKECLVILNSPDCIEAKWSRSNHLGSSQNGLESSSSYQWKLPSIPSNRLQKCFLRIRYNLTSSDFDNILTDYKFNQQKSPIKNNPQISLGTNNKALTLAINTAQYGRVFQDRSHSFFLMPRPSQIDNGLNVYNLNVKGKRGNIVQVYPAVEYDFVPNELVLNTNDILHIQWTGSNTHNNGNPGGDGQTGDSGQGRSGTDRINFVQINDLNENYPVPYEISTIWQDSEVIGYLNDSLTFTDDSNKYLTSLGYSNDLKKDASLYFASSSYYQCVNQKTCANSYDSLKTLVDSDLNQAPASTPGALLKFLKSNKIYYYMSSRNNNFSNRSQKGKIIVN